MRAGLMQIGQVEGDVVEGLARRAALPGRLCQRSRASGLRPIDVERGELRGGRLGHCVASASRAGRQQRLVDGLSERCVSGSKVRMTSISSPKNSTRMGRSIAGGEDIHDAAAMADLADLLDLGLRLVAERHQPLQQHARLESLAGASSTSSARELVGRHDRLGERARRADDDQPALVAPPALPSAFMRDSTPLARRDQPLVRQRVTELLDVGAGSEGVFS